MRVNSIYTSFILEENQEVKPFVTSLYHFLYEEFKYICYLTNRCLMGLGNQVIRWLHCRYGLSDRFVALDKKMMSVVSLRIREFYSLKNIVHWASWKLNRTRRYLTLATSFLMDYRLVKVFNWFKSENENRGRIENVRNERSSRTQLAEHWISKTVNDKSSHIFIYFMKI